MAVASDKDGDNQRATGEAEFHGHRHARQHDGNGAYQDAEEDADKHGEQVGVVQPLVGVAHAASQAVHILLTSHHRQAVADLQRQVGAGQQFDTGTVDAGNVDLITLVQAYGADLATVDVVLSDDDALAHDAFGGGLELPVKVDVRTDDGVEDVLVVSAHDDAQHVVLADDGLALRNLDRAVGALEARDGEVVVDDAMQAGDGDVIDEPVGHLIGDHVRLELAVFLLMLDVLDLLVHIDLEQ